MRHYIEGMLITKALNIVYPRWISRRQALQCFVHFGQPLQRFGLGSRDSSFFRRPFLFSFSPSSTCRLDWFWGQSSLPSPSWMLCPSFGSWCIHSGGSWLVLYSFFFCFLHQKACWYQCWNLAFTFQYQLFRFFTFSFSWEPMAGQWTRGLASTFPSWGRWLSPPSLSLREIRCTFVFYQMKCWFA